MEPPQPLHRHLLCSKVLLKRSPVTSRPPCCCGYPDDREVGAVCPASHALYKAWLQARAPSERAERVDYKEHEPLCCFCYHRITFVLILFFNFYCYGPELELFMAVTEAGCDLTYCKMRGIAAVLAGEERAWFLVYANVNDRCKVKRILIFSCDVSVWRSAARASDVNGNSCCEWNCAGCVTEKQPRVPLLLFRPPFVSQTSVLRSFHQGEEDGPERLLPKAGVHPSHLPTVSIFSASSLLIDGLSAHAQFDRTSKEYSGVLMSRASSP